MQGDEADCVVTDPPYGTLKHKIETGVNPIDVFTTIPSLLKDDSFFIFFGMFPPALDWLTAGVTSGLVMRNNFIWNKRHGTSPTHPYQRVHEDIFFMSKGFRPYNRTYLPWDDEFIMHDKRLVVSWQSLLRDKDRLQQYIDGVEWDKKRAEGHTPSISQPNDRVRWVGDLASLENGRCTPSILTIKRNSTDNYIAHPTVKPVTIMKVIINIGSNEGELCLDPFLGAGSTLLACENTDRRCYGVELFPEYCDIILHRWEMITGQLANKVS